MNRLKNFSAIAVVVGLGLCAPLASMAATATTTQDASLMAQAKVTQTQARATALANVPGGAVQSAELETEHGKLIWSFDIKAAGSPNIVEVQVDAKTGAVVSQQVETPADQAKEAQADKTAIKP